MSLLSLIGRNVELFESDISALEESIKSQVESSRFLIIGGAGSIGQAVTKEIFVRNPLLLHVVDISENNMVELVRDIRSSDGYSLGEFKTYSIDCGSFEFNSLIENEGPYDYVFNLSALKHVRSEKDPYTLMRLVMVNIFNTINTLRSAKKLGAKKYFCVSTDKAANPVNMMGASKRIMEMFLMRRSKQIKISTARFANVAFSDGSLLHGFNQRMLKNQPIVAPNDIKRYFVTSQEAGELCLMSCIFGDNRDIFFPKLDDALHLISFADIADKYLRKRGYKPYKCKSEEEARSLVYSHPKKGYWPCFFSSSDTTGEKDFEEFYTSSEIVDIERFKNIGIIKNDLIYNNELLEFFEDSIDEFKLSKAWNKSELVKLFNKMLPSFSHKDTGKYLDSKM